jgi:hypothetical protein
MNAAPRPTSPPPTRRQPWLLAGTFFLLGVGLTGYWFKRPNTRPTADPLSAATKSVLGQLTGPVFIRYYDLLPTDADPALQAYAGRVGALLSALQADSDGKVKVTILDNPAENNATAATTDGVQAFNLDQGSTSFLGLTMTSGRNREPFPHLQPEWEPALEADLARAIQRVAAGPVPVAPGPGIAKPSADIIASINRLIPDVSATTVENADQIFHAEFMNELAAADTERKTQLEAAQEQLGRAQAGGTQAELDAAQKNLTKVEIAQGEKIRQIATRLQTRLAVFQQMKAAANAK